MTTISIQSNEPPHHELLPPVVPDLFQALPDQPGLVGGYCCQCERHFFPLIHQCPSCYGPLERRLVGERGHIYSWTVVRTRAPFALPEPYAVGYIDLADVPLRVFCLLDPEATADLTVGAAVSLKAMSLGVNASGTPCVRPVYCLAREAA